MASFPQKAIIPTAVKTRSKFDLSNDNITTSDFFRIKPSRILECIPGDSINIQSESLIRMYPLAVPTFGRMNHFMRWYWVPMRTLMKGWNEFIENTPYVSPGAQSAALIPSVPYFLNSDIVQLFFDSIGSTPLNGYYATAYTGTGTPDAIISYRDPNNVLQQYKIRFTEEGRSLMDILQNLGYNINMDSQDKRVLSALPLLAYIRVMADYYISPQYITNVQALFNVTTGNIFTQVGYLADIFHDLLPGFSNYDPDLFVSAWDNPISPNMTSANPALIMNDMSIDPSVQYRSLVSNKVLSNDTPVVRGISTGNEHAQATNLSDYIVKSLRQITNYCVRNNIAGYKFWDRLEAEYGAVMDYKEKGTSLYIDSVVTQVKIDQVVSTADSQGADLGALAGQGLGYNQGQNIHFESKNEWGYLIAVSSLVPVTGYYQGTQKHCRHVDPMHFFHPDFESLGVDAIVQSDLFSSYFSGPAFDDAIHQSGSTIKPNDIFGFTPRYSEYKTALNTLSGNFRVGHLVGGGSVNSYHLFRQIADDFDWNINGTGDFHHNQSFIQGHNAQFDRVFANTSSEEDHFILIHHHEIHAERNMKSLSETIFDNEDFEHNKKVEVQYNGQVFN